MINVEGYKAFHGIMKITPKGMIVPEFNLEADWLYLPDKKVWIANGVEYSEVICTVVSDDAEKLIPKKATEIQYVPNGTLVYGRCPECHSFATNDFKYCITCGQALDWGDEE